MNQLFVAGNAPELERCGIWRWVDVRVKLRRAGMAGKPGRMRVAGIHGRVFQHAQAPAACGIRLVTTAQPVSAVVGVAAQILPGQCKVIQVQHVEIRGGGIPRLGASISHEATSCWAGIVATVGTLELRHQSLNAPRTKGYTHAVTSGVKTDWLRSFT
ncbi:hypothetical protein FQZ97_979910 [compost metagenome]